MDAVVTLVTEVGSSHENRAVPATGEGRKRIKGSGYKKFKSGTPLQTGWKTRSDVTKSVGSGRRNNREEDENHGSFQVTCFGVLRYDKTSLLD